MRFFIRKRIKVAPGVSLNIGSTRSSVTVGGKGVGVNVPLVGGRRLRRKKTTAAPARSGSGILFKLIVIALAAVTILLAIGNLATASDKLPAGAAVYDQFPAGVRPALLDAYAREMKRVDGEVSAATKSLAKAKGAAAREATKQERDQLKEKLTALKDVNDPPFVGCVMRGERKPGLIEEQWAIGSVGTTGREPLTVVQVSDETSAVMHRMNGKQLVIFKGIDAANWSDDEVKAMEGVWWVSGTQKFRTASGGQQILPVLERFDWDRYRKSLAQKAE